MSARSLVVLSCLVLLPGCGYAQDLSGTWVGGTNVTGSWRFTEVRFSPDGARLEMLSEQAAGLAVEELRVEAGRVGFRVQTPLGVFVFEGVVKGDVMEGIVTGAPVEGRLHLMKTYEPPYAQADAAVGTYENDDRRLVLTYGPAGQLTAFVFQRARGQDAIARTFHALPVAPDRYVTSGSVVPAMLRDEVLTLERNAGGAVVALRWNPPRGRSETWRRVVDLRQERVQFSGPAGLITGTVVSPNGTAPFPGVVIVSGSGPTLRGGTLLRAREFARIGVAALIYDKRGVGESDGDYMGASLTELADDAAAAFDFLRTRTDLHRDQIGMNGHSQGGWVAPLAAMRSAVPLAWMIVTSGGPVHPAEQEAWRAATQTRSAGGDAAAAEAAAEFMRRKWRYGLSGEDWTGYAAAARIASSQPWAGIVSPILVQDRSAWAFFRGLSGFDPMTAASALRMPVLVVFGDQDEELPVDIAGAKWREALQRSGHSEYEIVTIPGAGHSLWLGQGNPRPMDPRPTEVLRRWLENVLQSR